VAQTIAGPLTVTEPGGQRRTQLGATSINIGQRVTARTRTGAFTRTLSATAAGLIANPATLAQPGDVAVDPNHVPPVPDVTLEVGDRDASGGINVRDDQDRAIFSVNGANGLTTIGSDRGASGSLIVRSGSNGPVIFVHGSAGTITFFDSRLNTTMVIDANRGDIELRGADCAEDFEIAEPAEEGMVMCADPDGRLRPCRTAYNPRVIGVVSTDPAIRLGRRSDGVRRAPLALAGRVPCLVDATREAIRVGDLLTSSPTTGHAMRASNRDWINGSVVAKALGSLDEGRALVPVLVTLQ
jgi:hypothetical protein